MTKQTSVFEYLFDRQNKSIRGLFMFSMKQGRVPAHRHLNPDGCLGGWIADTAYVDPVAYVHETSLVYDNAEIVGGVIVHNNVKIFGNAKIENSLDEKKGYKYIHVTSDVH